MKFHHSSFLILLSCYVYASSQDPLVISTENGPVRGRWNLNGWQTIKKWFGVNTSSASRVFAGIPYAASPTGVNRFRPPQPLTDQWGKLNADGTVEGKVRELDSYPAACPQNFIIAFKQSEDCLNLSIYTPNPARITKKLPVLVWIFGGAFYFGDSTMVGVYNARYVTDSRDVIIVTLNHRLGPLGFFDSDETGANHGILDQLAALRWLKRNVDQFGGDPDNITMFGVSSGSTSALIMATSPKVESGLISKIIHQSGPVGTEMRTRKDIRAASKKLAFDLGCVSQDDVIDMKCLRDQPIKKIYEVAQLGLNDPAKDPASFVKSHDDIVDSFIGDQYMWWPSIDNDLIVGQPRDLIAQGKYQKLPMLIGTQRDEAGLWFIAFDIPILGQIKKNKRYGREAYTKKFQKIFGGDTNLVQQYYPISDDPETNVRSMIRLSTDYAFTCATNKVVDDWKHPNIFYYEWSLPTFPPLPRCLEMACHSNEIPFMFHTLWPIIGESRNRIFTHVQRYWVNFATTGDPNMKAEGERDQSVLTWPAYSRRKEHVEFGEQITISTRLREKECELWNDKIGYERTSELLPSQENQIIQQLVVNNSTTNATQSHDVELK